MNGISALISLALLALTHEACLLGARPSSIRETAYLHLLVLAQCALLTASAGLLQVVVPRWAHRIAGAALTVPLLVYVDALVLVRINLHLPAIGALLLDPHLDNNRKLLAATGIDLPLVVGFFVALVVVSTVGAWADQRTRALASRRRWLQPTRRAVVVAWVVALGALVGLQLGATRAMTATSWSRFAHAVPLVMSALGPTSAAKAAIRVRLRRPRSERASADALDRLKMPAEPVHGDVFFFVVESLRSDAVDARVSPALDALRRDSLPLEYAVSAGNVTHYGEFGLFWAEPAFHWRLQPDAAMRDGAVPLRIARKRGWRIVALASTPTAYLNAAHMIFGESRALADEFFDANDFPGSRGDRDARVMRELTERIAKPHPPTAYLVFLDAPHTPYSWAPEFTPPFTPYADASHYYRVQTDAAARAAVFNRYKNAVAFDDALLGRFFEALRASGGYGDATLVVVGDHGEEFWEHGFATHGGEACSVQTHVALLLKPPERVSSTASPPNLQASSTMDLWPTILDMAGVPDEATAFFDGTSLLRGPPRASLAADARHWSSPARFVLANATKKVLFELSQPDDASKEQDLYVRDLFDADDVPIHQDLTSSEYVALVRESFAADLERFFTVTW